MECYLLSQPKKAYDEFMAGKGYVLGIRTKIS